MTEAVPTHLHRQPRTKRAPVQEPRPVTAADWVKLSYKWPLSPLGLAVAQVLFALQGGTLCALEGMERIAWRDAALIDVPYAHRLESHELVQLVAQSAAHGITIKVLPRSNTTVTLRFAPRVAIDE